MVNIDIEDIDFKQTKAVVFDLDGTLYNKKNLPLRLIFGDLRYALVLGTERIVRRHMKGMSFPTAEQFYSTFFARIAKYHLMSAQHISYWYNERYMPLMVHTLKNHYEAYHFVMPLLQTLKKEGITTAVFSDYGLVEEKLEALGIDPKLFDYIFVGPDMGGLKPSKQLFEKVIAELGTKPEETLMIGDSPRKDKAGAESVGMKTLLVHKLLPNEQTI